MNKAHWEAVYATKASTTVSWYRPRLDQSLACIESLGLAPGARIVDVGGGASTLVDDLLGLGFARVTVIDLARQALEHTRARLGPRAAQVEFIEGDATQPLVAPASVDLWHDRAVFHFLADPARRAAYTEQLARAVRPRAYALLGTFALDGPERCSGLPVVRYDASTLAATLGPGFSMQAEARELHTTPAGNVQPFTYVLLRRADAP